MRSQYDNNKTTYFRLSDYPQEIDFDIEFERVCRDFLTRFQHNNNDILPILQNVYELAVKDLDVNLVYFHTIKGLLTKI